MTCRGWKGLVWHAAIAALYIAGGVVVIYDPMSVSALISLAVGGVLAAVGLARILIARQMRARGTGALGMQLTGCAGVVLGAMIMLEWPLSGLFAIALFIAVDLLLQGVSMVWLALRAQPSRGLIGPRQPVRGDRAGGRSRTERGRVGPDRRRCRGCDPVALGRLRQ